MKVPTIEPLEARIAPAILTITAIDSSKAEGSTLNGTTDFKFKVTLDAAEPQDVTVVATLADGTARFEDGDFNAFTQTITIPKGTREFEFSVPIKQDTTIEGNETFSVVLSSPSVNAAIGVGSASATILTDDLPKVSVVPIKNSLPEGSAPGGLTNFNFDIVLDRVSETDITVVINTKDGTAKVADGDYDAFTQTVTIPAGQLKAPSPVSIPIKHDATIEQPETFSVELTSPSSNAILGSSTTTVTIENDDPARLSIGAATVVEGALGQTSMLRFKVSLSTEASQPVTFDWATDLSGSATSGIDFTAVGSTTVTIPVGERDVFIDVPIIGDNADEISETVQVTIRNAKMGADTIVIEGQNSNGVVGVLGTIQNDDLTVSLAGPGSIVEGNSPNATFAEYVVQLSGTSNHPVEVTFDLENGTAKLGSDFNLPSSVTVTIPAGATTGTLRVPITVDNTFEADETFTVRVKSVKDAVVSGSDFVETTILNDDAAPILRFSQITPVETTEANADVQFSITVSLSQVSGKDVVFDWSMVNGTALAGFDFEAVSEQTVTIPAGQTTATLLLKTKGDKIHETSTIVVNAETGETKRAETFSVVLSSATGATIDSGASNRTVRILDTDAAPILKIDDVAAFEGDGANPRLGFKVSITNDVTSDAPIQFNWVAGLGSATPGVDYTVVTGSPATLAAGAKETTLFLNLNDDSIDEIDETVQVGIANAVMGSTNIVVEDSQATGRILNDDLSLTIQAITANVIEGATNTTTLAKYRISLPTGVTSAHDVTVVVQFDSEASTATLGTDFTLPGSMTVTIPAGQNSVDFDVTVKGDAAFEADDTITLKLVDPVNAKIGTGSAVAKITNDDPLPPELSIVDASLEEGDNGNTVMNFTVKLNHPAGEDITFDWSTIDGTALGGIDFSKVVNRQGKILKGTDTATISVAVSGDTLVEVDETFTIQLSNAKLGTETITIADGEAIGTIENDDIQVRVAGASISEGTGAGTKNLEFAITLTQVSDQPVTVTFKVKEGTAKEGVDYADLPEFMTAVIPAGQMSGTITIPIIMDGLDEQNETFTIELTDATNAKVGTATATGTILDDDAAPVVSIVGGEISEGDSGTKNFTFKVKLSTASGQDVRVAWTPTSGTATAGIDFAAAGDFVTIPAGTLEKEFFVTVNGDTAFENDENFTVALSNATGASISPTEGTATGVIQNDDVVPTLTIANFTANENAGTINFTINLSAASGLPITFTATTANGTAIAGKDFAAKTQNFTIAPGQTTATFSVAISDDSLFERDETFSVNLTNIVGAANTSASALGTIDDNEDFAPTVTVGDVTVVEGDNGEKAFEVTVSLTQLAGSDVTFDWALVTGSATRDVDFKLVDGQTSPFVIPAGQSSVKLKFVAIGDTADEADEDFTVQVSNPKLGGDTLFFTDGKDFSKVTLQNDDLTVSVADWTVVEGNTGTTTLKFIITLSAASTHTVRVDYKTQDGTAISTGGAGIQDYIAKTGFVEFAPGVTSKEVEIVVNGDVTFDGTDQMKLILTGATNARIADGEATGTITDDDGRPVVSIDQPDSIREDAGDDDDDSTPAGQARYEFKVRLDHASDETVEVSVSTVNGTAKAGSDFTGITNQRIIFAPGETEKTVVVTVLDDSVFEADQTFDVVLSDPLRASLAPIKKATGVIEADEDAAPTIKITGQDILEGNNGERFVTFTIQRTGATDEEIKFDFETIDGTATSTGINPDFEAQDREITMLPGESTKTVMVKVFSDTDDVSQGQTGESDEQFQARITPITGATRAEGHDGTATATIFNDDLTVSLDQGVVQVLEGNSGQSDLVFKVNLSAKTNFPIVLTYEIQQSAGTATFGTDYLAPTVLSVTIPAGSTFGEIRIPIVGDTTAETGETVSIKLTGATNAELATSDLTATGTILNDDASLSIGNATRIEGTTGSGVMRFVVKLDAPFSYPVTVNYSTANGTATSGSDYTATQGSVTFAQGETEQFIDVPILGDTTIEGDETFTVVLSNPSGAAILTGTGTGTIQDDESFFSINDVSIDEGDGGTRTINFTVSRSPGTSVGASVRVSTLDGTAISNGLVPDFISKSEVITFAANETSKTFSVVVNSDRVFELNSESFFVKLSDPTGAAILDGEGTGTINNGADSAPSIRINDASVVEGLSGTKMLKFVVALSEASDTPVTFDFKTVLSTGAFAADAEDFTEVATQSFTIPAGQKTIEIEVPVNGDDDPEADEVLLGKIENAKAGAVTLSISDDQADGTIRNDDLTVSIDETASGLEGNGATTIKVRVNLLDANGVAYQAPQDIAITLQIAGGTAVLGTDFTAPTLTVTIPAGANGVDIDVPIKGDTLHEDSETLTLTVTGATHALLGNTTSTVTITNDDAAPELRVADISVVEGQNAVFKVKLTDHDGKPVVSGKDVVVKWVTEFVEDSADPSDFTHSGVVQILTIPAGQTEGTITIATNNDSTDEFAETFKLRILSTTENATLTGDITATATIEANDLGSYSVDDATVIEGSPSDPKTIAFTVKRTASNLPGSVRYVTSDGTAKAGLDYDAKEGVLEFAAGESSKTVLITITGDNISEIDETFFIGLSDAVNGTVSKPFATGKILNDEITYRIAFADAAGNLLPAGNKVAEGDSGEQFAYFYVIREAGAGVSNGLDVSGTVFYSTGQNPASGAVLATAGSDFSSTSGTVSFSPSSGGIDQRSQLLKVPIKADGLTEADETFLIKLSNPVNGQLSTTDSEKVVTIDDDDEGDLPYVVIDNAKLVEGADGATTDMVFKVRLRDSSLTAAQAAGGAIKVYYSTADILAAAGVDYTAAAEDAFITFAAGETEKEIRISILGDSLDELDDTFNVKIDRAEFVTPGTNVAIPLATSHLPSAPAVGTITNDDLTITLDPLSQFVEGDGSHTIKIKAILSQASTHDVSFTVNTKDGTAVSGATGDYKAIEGTDRFVVIPAGQTEAFIEVDVNGDVFSEADETFTLLLSDPANATLGTTTQVITILNDDAAPTLSIGDASIVEGDDGQANLVFTVVLSGATNTPVTFNYKTVDGTAKSTGPLVDFVAQSGSRTIPASPTGTITETITIPIRGDTWMEANETFTVELSNAQLGGSTTGVTITDATATGQIVDDGDNILGVIVHDAKVVEGSSGETKQLQFTIETTAPVQGSAITLTANTRIATASAGDFTALQNQTVTIAAGQSQATVTVNVTGDNAYEAAEHLWLDITGFKDNVKAVNGSATTATAAGVILNDDVNVVSGREFQYVDTDGDLVTVKFSKGTLRVQTGTTTNDTNNITFSAINSLGGRNLDLINLAVDGFAYEGVNISVTAKPQVLVTGEVLGDAKANVGTLTAAALAPDLFQISSGIGLGNVKISGNLDHLISGSTKRPTGAKLIEVGSFGSDSDQGSVVLGPIGKMIVHGDFMGNLRMVGDVAVQPIPGGVGKIKTLIIEGNLQGGTKDGSGRITFTGGIGTARIGGIIGGTGQASGSIAEFSDEFRTKIGSLTVLGDVAGGVGANSAFVNVDQIGSLAIGKASGSSSQRVSGSLVGGSGEGSGFIIAETFGSVVINGDIRGGSGNGSGHLRATESLGNVRLTGSVVGGTNNNESGSGLIQTGAIRGTLTIEGGVVGGAGANSGLVFVNGSAKSITLGKSGADGGTLKGGNGAGSGRIDVNGTLSKFLAYGNIEGGKGTASGSLIVGNSLGTGSITTAVIKGDIIGGSTDASGVSGGVSSLLGSGFVEADRIGSITVEGKLQSGKNEGTALAKSAGIHAGEIGTVNVGSVEGNAGTPVIISAVRSIGKATFGGNVEFLELLAGYSAPSDATKPRGFMYNAGATIGTVTVNGEMTASSIVAGVNPGNDGKFGTSDDVGTVTGDSQNPNPGNQQLISRIASVVIKNVGSQSGVPVNAIVAEQINALKIAGARVPLTAGAHNDGPDLVGSNGSTVQIFEI